MCFFAAVEGVCDTPVHLFGHFTDNMMTERCTLPQYRGLIPVQAILFCFMNN